MDRSGIYLLGQTISQEKDITENNLLHSLSHKLRFNSLIQPSIVPQETYEWTPYLEAIDNEYKLSLYETVSSILIKNDTDKLATVNLSCRNGFIVLKTWVVPPKDIVVSELFTVDLYVGCLPFEEFKVSTDNSDIKIKFRVGILTHIKRKEICTSAGISYLADQNNIFYSNKGLLSKRQDSFYT